LVFYPIQASSRDTTETLRQIAKHNASLRIVCPNS